MKLVKMQIRTRSRWLHYPRQYQETRASAPGWAGLYKSANRWHPDGNL